MRKGIVYSAGTEGCPCCGCQERTVGCHGTCERYKAWNGSRNLEKPRETVVEVAKSRKLRAPKHYRVVEEISYYSEMTGFTRYMKAIRIGGEDYGEGKPHEQYFDGEG